MAATAERLATGTLKRVNQVVIWVYRSSGGRLLNTSQGMAVLLLTTMGRRSGLPRTTPTVFVRDGANFLVVGTYAGRDRTPSWCGNLRAEPSARVEIGAQTWEVRAAPTSGPERDRLWEVMSGRYPGLRKYLAKTDRVFPVFVLEPVL